MDRNLWLRQDIDGALTLELREDDGATKCCMALSLEQTGQLRSLLAPPADDVVKSYTIMLADGQELKVGKGNEVEWAEDGRLTIEAPKDAYAIDPKPIIASFCSDSIKSVLCTETYELKK